MKIAINCSFFTPKAGGIKEYIFNLTNNLALIDRTNEYILYVAEDQYDYAMSNLFSDNNMRIKKTPFLSSNSIKRSLFERRFFLNEEINEKIDIFHSPFFHIPPLKRAKTVITVHDLRLYRFPQTYTFLRYIFLRHAVARSIKCVNHIITISEFTKSEVLSLFEKNESDITSIHEAINLSSFNENLIKDYIPSIELTNHPFFLSVGHLEPRKNYEKLILAFNKFKTSYTNNPIKLVIVGQKSFGFEKTIQLIKESKDIIYLNFVEHKLLIWLYKNAKLFILPSYYEGFGFPPLEAAALNTVSAVSNLSSLPEVCGSSSLYFDPNDIDTIVNSMSIVLEYPEIIEEKRMLLRQNIDRFSWKQNAIDTLSVYNKIYSL